jgi:hypothetical protein
MDFEAERRSGASSLRNRRPSISSEGKGSQQPRAPWESSSVLFRGQLCVGNASQMEGRSREPDSGQSDGDALASHEVRRRAAGVRAQSACDQLNRSDPRPR